MHPIKAKIDKRVAVQKEQLMPSAIYVYFLWEGRISRMTYWLYSLPLVALHLVNIYYISHISDVLPITLSAFIIYTGVMISSKRSHDLGRSGWFILVGLIPLINLWPFFEFGFEKGSKERNSYGDPAVWDYKSIKENSAHMLILFAAYIAAGIGLSFWISSPTPKNKGWDSNKCEVKLITVPDDEDSRALLRMRNSGIDLSRSREIDFFSVFKDEESVIRFTDDVREMGYDEVNYSYREETKAWDTRVRVLLLPTHANIKSTVSKLDKVARSYGGRADGWDCKPVD
jgi:uncharacterized membrane protein YhaH (DUF805 family)